MHNKKQIFVAVIPSFTFAETVEILHVIRNPRTFNLLRGKN